MKEVAIRVQNLGKQYFINKFSDTITGSLRNIFSKQQKELFWALKDVSFEVVKGESIGIIGRNGAGKSTLLKILSRITLPSVGKVMISGKVASLLEVGTGFHPELTGKENIFLNGALLGMSRLEVKLKLDEIVDFSGIEKFIDTPVKKYSSGMYVRLAFAVAAHLDSDILFVDEVLAVGDFEFQQKCLGKMDDLSKKNGKTVIFVSHNLSLISQLCNQALLLDQGTIKGFGVTAEIIRNFQRSQISGGNFLGAHIKEHPSKKDHNFGIVSCMYISNKIENNLVYTGKEFSIIIDYEIELDLDNVEVGFILKDENHKPLLGLNNVHLGKQISLKQGNGTFCIKICQFPICTSSRIFVDLFFGNSIHLYECLENVFSFELFHLPFYGGRLIDRNKNVFLYKDITIEKIE